MRAYATEGAVMFWALLILANTSDSLVMQIWAVALAFAVLIAEHIEKKRESR